MVKSVYNLDQVTRIVVTKKTLTNNYTFVKGFDFPIKFFSVKSGYRHQSSIVDPKIHTKEELEQLEMWGTRYLVEDDKVYVRPTVVLHFSDGSQKTLFFNTDNEAQWKRGELCDKLQNVHLELYKS